MAPFGNECYTFRKPSEEFKLISGCFIEDDSIYFFLSEGGKSRICTIDKNANVVLYDASEIHGEGYFMNCYGLDTLVVLPNFSYIMDISVIIFINF